MIDNQNEQQDVVQPDEQQQPEPQKPKPDTREIVTDPEVDADGDVVSDKPQPSDPGDLTSPPNEGEVLEIHSPLPAGMQQDAKDFAADIAAIARDRGIGRGPAEAALNFVTDTALAAGGVGDGGNPRETMHHLTTKYGAGGVQKVVAGARRAVQSLGPDVAAYLDKQDNLGRRLSDNAAVIEMLNEFSMGTFSMNPEQARAQREALQKSKEYTKGLPAMTARLRALNAIINTDKSAKGERKALADALAARKNPPKPPSASAKDKLLAEARTIRLDPAYASASHANHKQLVNRMQEIYGQLYPGGR
jgi:hypothetical protein